MPEVAKKKPRPAKGKKVSAKAPAAEASADDAKKKAKPKAKQGPAPKKKSPAAKLKAERKKLQKREDLCAELVQEISLLRDHLATTGQTYVARMDGAIASILCAFDGHGIPGEPERLPTARVQASMLLALRNLKLKPEKGRLKDLGRIQEVADLLSRLMPQGG